MILPCGSCGIRRHVGILRGIAVALFGRGFICPDCKGELYNLCRDILDREQDGPTCPNCGRVQTNYRDPILGCVTAKPCECGWFAEPLEAD